MIWKKKKDASAEAAETAEAKSGVSAFAKKNWKWLVPVVVAAAAGAVFLIGGGNKAASRDVTYAETTPTRQDVSNSLSGTGTLNPANTYTVKSLVDGKILTGGFEEGDKVEEGDVLYTIDSSDASTNLEKASIALQQAQRSYDKTVDLQYCPRRGGRYGQQSQGRKGRPSDQRPGGGGHPRQLQDGAEPAVPGSRRRQLLGGPERRRGAGRHL